MTTEEKLEMAMGLLERVEANEVAPDVEWFHDYYLLTGDHMICTDEGWEPGENKQSYQDNPDYDDDGIIDEVNAPEVEESNE